MTDMSDIEERSRLFSYFAHRFVTFAAIFKEIMRRKRVQAIQSQKGGGGAVAQSKAANSGAIDHPVVNTEIKGQFILFNSNRELYADF